MSDTKKRFDDDGRLHCLDAPAVVWGSQSMNWYQHGKRHRSDGPAVEYADGSKEWWIDGKLHHLDGPAVERVNDNRWYRDGKECLYHGSNRLITQLQTDKGIRRDWGDFGYGTYLAAIPRWAIKYAFEATAKKGGQPHLHIVENRLTSIATVSDFLDLIYEITEPDAIPYRNEKLAKQIRDKMLSRGFDATYIHPTMAVYAVDKLSIVDVVAL